MIDILLFSAINDSKISHEEFTNIITEKNIYENIKENLKYTAELTTESSALARSYLGRTAEPSSLERIEEKSTTL